MPSHFPVRGDQKLIQIVDAALADTTLRSGDWLACRPGCTQCCMGAFAINQLDALRLERGLRTLQSHDPDRAAAVVQRAKDSAARLSATFPGDPETGVLDESEEATQCFAEFANDEPCPALNPQTGLCELYDALPFVPRMASACANSAFKAQRTTRSPPAK